METFAVPLSLDRQAGSPEAPRRPAEEPKEFLMVFHLRARVLWLLRGGSTSAGQTLVEYSLLLAFVASMIIALAVVVGGTGGLLDFIGNQITGALS
jgi:Flp pilus assembly pilin Flp